MKDPLVSIISLNYNQTEVTCEFLRSLHILEYNNYEVLIVDNASDENPESEFKVVYPNLQFIRSESNLGYAGGNNLGIRKARGEYLFIVNNDTEVTSLLLNVLVASFDVDKMVGIVCPKIKYYDHPKLIQYAGFTAINPYTGRNKTIGKNEIDKGQYNRGGYTNYAHGAAMMVKSSTLADVGLIPELFFLCYEEMDWSVRMVKAGYKIYYEGRATIFHKESVTMGKESPLKAYFHLRNRILFMRRNYSGIRVLIFYFYLLIVVVPKTLLKYAFGGKRQHLRSTLDALLWHLRGYKESFAGSY